MWQIVSRGTGNIVGVTFTKLAAEIIARSYTKRGRAVVLMKINYKEAQNGHTREEENLPR
jgi:hypothetical protein